MLTCLDTVVDVLGQRLTWLGISCQTLSTDAAQREVPLLDLPVRRAGSTPVRLPENTSRHLSLELGPSRVLLSIYEVRGGDQAVRSERLKQLAETLASAIGPSIPYRTWSHAFFEHEVDVYFAFYGLDMLGQRRLLDFIHMLVTSETIRSLGRASLQFEPAQPEETTDATENP